MADEVLCAVKDSGPCKTLRVSRCDTEGDAAGWVEVSPRPASDDSFEDHVCVHYLPDGTEAKRDWCCCTRSAVRFVGDALFGRPVEGAAVMEIHIALLAVMDDNRGRLDTMWMSLA